MADIGWLGAGALDDGLDPLTAVLGRRRQLSALQQRLVPGATLAIVPSSRGVGASHLAAAAARRSAMFPGGVLHWSLSVHGRLLLPVLHRFAVGLGADWPGSASRDAQLSALAAAVARHEDAVGPTLWIIDDVDADAVADVEQLLAQRGSGTGVLLVCDEPVAETLGALPATLGPLSIVEALSLLREAAGVSFPQNDAVALLEHADGLPLSVKLFGMRHRLTGEPARALVELNTRTAPLAAMLPLADGPAGALAALLVDLPTTVQQGFRWLGAFARGTATHEDLAGVAYLDPASARGVMSRLAEVGLLRTLDDGSFALTRSIHDLARALLEGHGELDEAAERHLSHISQRVESLATAEAADQPQLLRLLPEIALSGARVARVTDAERVLRYGTSLVSTEPVLSSVGAMDLLLPGLHACAKVATEVRAPVAATLHALVGGGSDAVEADEGRTVAELSPERREEAGAQVTSMRPEAHGLADEVGVWVEAGQADATTPLPEVRSALAALEVIGSRARSIVDRVHRAPAELRQVRGPGELDGLLTELGAAMDELRGLPAAAEAAWSELQQVILDAEAGGAEAEILRASIAADADAADEALRVARDRVGALRSELPGALEGEAIAVWNGVSEAFQEAIAARRRMDALLQTGQDALSEAATEAAALREVVRRSGRRAVEVAQTAVRRIVWLKQRDEARAAVAGHRDKVHASRERALRVARRVRVDLPDAVADDPEATELLGRVAALLGRLDVKVGEVDTCAARLDEAGAVHDLNTACADAEALARDAAALAVDAVAWIPEAEALSGRLAEAVSASQLEAMKTESRKVASRVAEGLASAASAAAEAQALGADRGGRPVRNALKAIERAVRELDDLARDACDHANTVLESPDAATARAAQPLVDNALDAFEDGVRTVHHHVRGVQRALAEILDKELEVHRRAATRLLAELGPVVAAARARVVAVRAARDGTGAIWPEGGHDLSNLVASLDAVEAELSSAQRDIDQARSPEEAEDRIAKLRAVPAALHTLSERLGEVEEADAEILRAWSARQEAIAAHRAAIAAAHAELAEQLAHADEALAEAVEHPHATHASAEAHLSVARQSLAEARAGVEALDGRADDAAVLQVGGALDSRVDAVAAALAAALETVARGLAAAKAHAALLVARAARAEEALAAISEREQLLAALAADLDAARAGLPDDAPPAAAASLEAADAHHLRAIRSLESALSGAQDLSDAPDADHLALFEVAFDDLLASLDAALREARAALEASAAEIADVRAARAAADAAVDEALANLAKPLEALEHLEHGEIHGREARDLAEASEDAAQAARAAALALRSLTGRVDAGVDAAMARQHEAGALAEQAHAHLARALERSGQVAVASATLRARTSEVTARIAESLAPVAEQLRARAARLSEALSEVTDADTGLIAKARAAMRDAEADLQAVQGLADAEDDSLAAADLREADAIAALERAEESSGLAVARVEEAEALVDRLAEVEASLEVRQGELSDAAAQATARVDAAVASLPALAQDQAALVAQAREATAALVLALEAHGGCRNHRDPDLATVDARVARAENARAEAASAMSDLRRLADEIDALREELLADAAATAKAVDEGLTEAAHGLAALDEARRALPEPSLRHHAAAAALVELAQALDASRQALAAISADVSDDPLGLSARRAQAEAACLRIREDVAGIASARSAAETAAAASIAAQKRLLQLAESLDARSETLEASAAARISGLPDHLVDGLGERLGEALAGAHEAAEVLRGADTFADETELLLELGADAHSTRMAQLDAIDREVDEAVARAAALLDARERLRALRDARAEAVGVSSAALDRDEPASLPPAPDADVVASLDAWRKALSDEAASVAALVAVDVDAMMDHAEESSFEGQIEAAVAEAEVRLDEVLASRASLDAAIAVQLDREREIEAERRARAARRVEDTMREVEARRVLFAELQVGVVGDAALAHLAAAFEALVMACSSDAAAVDGADSGVEALGVAEALEVRAAQLDEAIDAARLRLAARDAVREQQFAARLGDEADRVAAVRAPRLPDVVATREQAERWSTGRVVAALAAWSTRLRVLSLWPRLRSGTLAWLTQAPKGERDPLALAEALRRLAEDAETAWLEADDRLNQAIDAARSEAHARLEAARDEALDAARAASDEVAARGAEAASAAEGWNSQALREALAALHEGSASLDGWVATLAAEASVLPDAASVEAALARLAEACAEVRAQRLSALEAATAAQREAAAALEAAIAEARVRAVDAARRAGTLAESARSRVDEAARDAEGFEGLDTVSRSRRTIGELADAASEAALRAEGAERDARQAVELSRIREAAQGCADAVASVEDAVEGQLQALDALRRALRGALRARLGALSEQADAHLAAIRRVDNLVHRLFEEVRRPAVIWRGHAEVEPAIRAFDEARRLVRAAVEAGESAQEACARTASLGRAEAAVAAAEEAARGTVEVEAALDAVCEALRSATRQAQDDALASELARRDACASELASIRGFIEQRAEAARTRVRAWTLDEVLRAAVAVEEPLVTIERATNALAALDAPNATTPVTLEPHARAIQALFTEAAAAKAEAEAAIHALDGLLKAGRDAQLRAFAEDAKRALVDGEDAAVRASLFLGTAEAEAGPLAGHVFVAPHLQQAREASEEAQLQAAALRVERDALLAITDVAARSARCEALGAIVAAAEAAAGRVEQAAAQVPGSVRDAEADEVARRAAAEAARRVSDAAQQAWDELELTIEAARSEFELRVASDARQRWDDAIARADQVREHNEVARQAASAASAAQTRDQAERARAEAQGASDAALELSSSLLALLPELLDAQHAATRATRALLEARLEVGHLVVQSRQLRGQVLRAFRVSRDGAAVRPSSSARSRLARLLALTQRIEGLGMAVDAMHDAVQLTSDPDDATRVAEDARDHVERLCHLAALAHADAVQIGRGQLSADVRERVAARRRLHHAHRRASGLVAVSAKGLAAAGAWLRAGQRWPEGWRDEPEVVSVASGVVSGASALIDTWERVHQLARRALNGADPSGVEADLSRARDAAGLAEAAAARLSDQVDELGAVLRDAHARRVALREDMLTRRREVRAVSDRLQELMAPAALARRLALFEQGLRLARRRDEPAALRAWLVDTSEACAESGDLDRARALLAEASELAGAAGATAEQAQVLRALARLDLRSGAPRTALDRIHKAIDVGPEAERDATRLDLLAELGEAHLGLGDLQEARALLTEALERAHFTGEVWLAASHHGRLARLELLDGRLAVASAHAEAALSGYRSVGDRLGEARELVRLSGLRLRQRRFLAALDAARMATERVDARGAPSLAALAAAAEAAALRSLGRPHAATRAAEDGLARAGAVLPEVRNLLETQRAAGMVSAARGVEVPDLDLLAAAGREQGRRWRRGVTLEAARSERTLGPEAIEAARDALDGADDEQRGSRLALLVAAMVDAGQADEVESLIALSGVGAAGPSLDAAITRARSAGSGAQA